jgi:replicative DNA helicase
MIPFDILRKIEADVLSEPLHTQRLMEAYGHILCNPNLFMLPGHKAVSEGIAYAFEKNVSPTSETIFVYVVEEHHDLLRKMLAQRIEPEEYPGSIAALEDSYVGRETQRVMTDALEDWKTGKIRTAAQAMNRISGIEDDLFNFHPSRPRPVSEVVTSLQEDMRETAEFGEPPGGLYMGSYWPELGQKLGMIRRGDLMIEAARPGEGKTSYLISKAFHTANLWRKTGSKRQILYITAEEIAEDIATRFLQAFNPVFTDLVDNKSLTAMNNIADAFKNGGWPIHIAALPEITPGDIRRMIRDMIRQYGPDPIIMVDYLQLIKPDRRMDTDAGDLSSIVRAMKIAANTFACTIDLAAQLKRDIDLRKEEIVFMSDIAGTSGAEQHSTKVVFFRKPRDTNGEGYEYFKHYLKVFIPKNRKGRVIVRDEDAIRMSYEPERTFLPAGSPDLKVMNYGTVQQVLGNAAPNLGI